VGVEGAGSGRKRKKICNIVQYFAIEKGQRGEPAKIGRELGLVLEVGSLTPPPPPTAV